MKIEITDAVWLDERQQFSLAELAELSGLPEPELKQLIDYETLLPTDPGSDPIDYGVTVTNPPPADCTLFAFQSPCRSDTGQNAPRSGRDQCHPSRL